MLKQIDDKHYIDGDRVEFIQLLRDDTRTIVAAFLCDGNVFWLDYADEVTARRAIDKIMASRHTALSELNIEEIMSHDAK